MSTHQPVTVRFFGTACCERRAMGALCTCAADCEECVEAATRWAFGPGGNASYRIDFQRARHSRLCSEAV